ncbi:Uncharacterised protein [Burkholderia pseudomallei]|nr:Uncharacterised protein [Burkholderia pseudomallei]
MSRQPAPLTAVEPDVLLWRWRIFETDDCLKRLVGYDLLDRECVTSALVSFSHKDMRAKTSDGLTYQLMGKPGFFWDVVDVWDAWFNSAGAVKDVTERLLAKSTRDPDA